MFATAQENAEVRDRLEAKKLAESFRFTPAQTAALVTARRQIRQLKGRFYGDALKGALAACLEPLWILPDGHVAHGTRVWAFLKGN